MRTLRGAFQDRQLLPQGQVFQDQFPLAAERQRQRTADDDQQLQHGSIVSGVGPMKTMPASSHAREKDARSERKP